MALIRPSIMSDGAMMWQPEQEVQLRLKRLRFRFGSDMLGQKFLFTGLSVRKSDFGEPQAAGVVVQGAVLVQDA